jgi:hypothetical protein
MMLRAESMEAAETGAETKAAETGAETKAAETGDRDQGC